MLKKDKNTASENRSFTKNSNPLPLMSKGEEEQTTVRRASNRRKDPFRKTEEVYCH